MSLLSWRHLRAWSRFYRSIAPFSLSVTVMMALLLLPFRDTPNYAVPLLLKLLTWPPLLYLYEEFRADNWWWWHNLGYARWQLRSAAFALDMLLFGLMLKLVFTD